MPRSGASIDRKSTRLNSSHANISYAVFCLKKKIAITVHEAGHALAIRHYGRRVRQLGVALYYLFPCVYVDSTDMTLASRRERVLVSLVGPLAGIVVAAACALLAAADPDTLAGTIAFKAATLFVF